VCRAKFITGSVAQLLAKQGGGAAWLLGLRAVPYPEAAAALCTLPGIGPKVCGLSRNTGSLSKEAQRAPWYGIRMQQIASGLLSP
jgi:endonuclease III